MKDVQLRQGLVITLFCIAGLVLLEPRAHGLRCAVGVVTLLIAGALWEFFARGMTR